MLPTAAPDDQRFMTVRSGRVVEFIAVGITFPLVGLVSCASYHFNKNNPVYHNELRNSHSRNSNPSGRNISLFATFGRIVIQSSVCQLHLIYFSQPILTLTLTSPASAVTFVPYGCRHCTYGPHSSKTYGTPADPLLPDFRRTRCPRSSFSRGAPTHPFTPPHPKTS